MKIEVGKKYELNNGEIAECTSMNIGDPWAVDEYGYGPFVIGGTLYHQDGRFADCDADHELSVKREVFTIQPGKYYKTRDVRKVGPMRSDRHGDFDIAMHNDADLRAQIWNPDGTVWSEDGDESDHYLISEWTEDDDLNAICDERQDGPFVRDPELTSPYGDNNHPLPPMTGTLKELNVKQGDVVEDTKVGMTFTVKEIGDGSVSGKSEYQEGYTDDHDVWNLNGINTWRIISRASDTPKTWGEMTDAEKGALLLAWHEGKVIEWNNMHCSLEWDSNGTPNWNHWAVYRIKPQPQRETVTLSVGEVGGKWINACDHNSHFVTHRITFTTTDGEPDLDSIKMERV